MMAPYEMGEQLSLVIDVLFHSDLDAWGHNH